MLIEEKQLMPVAPGERIKNVFTRVTGINPSEINGILGTTSNRNFDPSNANLFLINPNGIIFGENGSLDINGCFVGTTANAIAFGEQGFFSATDPQAPPLLTVNPDGLLFNQIIQNANIQNNSKARTGLRDRADSRNSSSVRVMQFLQNTLQLKCSQFQTIALQVNLVVAGSGAIRLLNQLGFIV
jgi:filamentous hemagglutinin family protein